MLPTAGLGNPPLLNPHFQGLPLQTEKQERFPLLSQGMVNIPFFPSVVQADKAVARVPNLRGLGEPFLKHTFVADSEMTTIYCWLIITRKEKTPNKP